MLGEYRVFVGCDYASSCYAWTVTTTSGGEVVWVKEGVVESSSTTYMSDDDSTDNAVNDSTTSQRMVMFLEGYSPTSTNSCSSTY